MNRLVMYFIVLVSLFTGLCSVTHAQDDFSVGRFLQGEAFVSDDNGYSVVLGGLLHADINGFDGVFNNDEGGDFATETFVRRGRLSLSGFVTSNWQYRVQAVLEKNADNDVSDAYVVYKGFGPKFWLRLGKQKEDLGLEWVTSSNMTVAIERSAVTRAFSHIRSDGISLMGRANNYSYSFGLHKNDHVSSDKYVSTGRLVKKHLNNQREQFFQWGGGFSYRDGERGEIRVRPEVREIASENRISSGLFESKTNIVLNLESLFIKGPWHISAELYHARFKDEDYEGGGGYVTAAYFITGEKLIYDDLQGRPFGVIPLATSGAWEVFSRTSWLNLEDKGKGNKANIITLGANWYLNSNMRVMFNYVHAEYDKPPLELGDTTGYTYTAGDALMGRLQLRF